MNAKLIFKLSILIFGLVMVIVGSRYFSSKPFESSLDQVFQAGSQFQWCATQPNHFKWLNQKIAEKNNSLSPDQLAKKFCFVQMESIQGVDIKKAKWEQIATSLDSGGQPVYLEWDQALQLFRAAGLPFKSPILYKELSQ